MNKTFYYFVKNSALRENLDSVFNHIVFLMQLIDSGKYTEDSRSSFRKTVIIHLSSIAEALMFYVLDKKFTDDDISEYYSNWEVKNEKILYEVKKDSHKIIAGDYKKIKSKSTKKKMNLHQVATFLKDKEILGKELFLEIDKLRTLRNGQHLGTHTELQKYSKKDLRKSFATVRNVKVFVKKVFEKEK